MFLGIPVKNCILEMLLTCAMKVKMVFLYSILDQKCIFHGLNETNLISENLDLCLHFDWIYIGKIINYLLLTGFVCSMLGHVENINTLKLITYLLPSECGTSWISAGGERLDT